MGEDLLETVESYRYLGITMNYCLDPECTLTVQASAASHALGNLIGKTRTNYDLGYHSYTRLYYSMVVPVMDYAIASWNVGNACKKLDNIQNRAMRYYLGVPRSCPIAGLIGETGWVPGTVCRDVESIRLYNQII